MDVKNNEHTDKKTKLLKEIDNMEFGSVTAKVEKGKIVSLEVTNKYQ